MCNRPQDRQTDRETDRATERFAESFVRAFTKTLQCQPAYQYLLLAGVVVYFQRVVGRKS